jgi:hypothetical protein
MNFNECMCPILEIWERRDGFATVNPGDWVPRALRKATSCSRLGLPEIDRVPSNELG